jgi:hypothetical protein
VFAITATRTQTVTLSTLAGRTTASAESGRAFVTGGVKFIVKEIEVFEIADFQQMSRSV